MAQDQYDILKTYPSFGGGISDDQFIGAENSVQDMDGIELQEEDRYCTLSDGWTRTMEYDLYGGEPTWVKSTPYGPFRGNISSVITPTGGQLSLGTIDGMESYGSGSDQINYFFDRTVGVKKTNYDGSSVISTITSGYPTANTEVTAIGWNSSNLLFAKSNTVYSMNTVGTETVTTAVSLRPGTRVRYIYSYSVDSVVVMATNGDTTLIYELEFTGSAYNIVSILEEKDYKLIKAVGNKYNIFWISHEGIHQYQGRQTQPVKRITLTESAKIGWDRGVMIADNYSILYRYRSLKPGRYNILTKQDIGLVVLAVDNNAILGRYSSLKSFIYTNTAYFDDGTITLRPLDGGSYETPKHDLSYRLGYILPRWDSTPETIKAGIVVSIMTDEMERINTNNYIEVGRIETDSFGYYEISSHEVAKALETAGYNSEFGYVRTKITLKAGKEYTSPAGFFQKTPKLFDFTIKANYVKR